MSFLSEFWDEGLRDYLECEIAEEEANTDLTPEEVLDRAELFLALKLRPGIPTRSRINKFGSGKKRTIYIYPPEDQLMLKTVHYCLARTDLGLLPCCLAFRPGFSVHRAFRKVMNDAREEYGCIRLDITNYFNSIPAESLAGVLENRLSAIPGIVPALKGLLLDTRIIENGVEIRDTEKGAMAGMPLAPLLANLYLSDFDREMVEKVPVYGRYSDDLVLFCPPEKIPAVMEKIREALLKRGLSLNEGKTRITGPGEKWEFLGLSCDRGNVSLSDAAIKKMKGKISRSARKLYRWKLSKNASTERAVRAMIRKFQFKFFGTGGEDDELTWSRWYFPLINRTEGLREVDQYLQQWMRYLADGRHRKLNYKKIPYSLLREYGYVPLLSVYRDMRRDPVHLRTQTGSGIPKGRIQSYADKTDSKNCDGYHAV